MTPLHVAALNEAEQAMRVLLGRGADVTVRAADGATPLHVAAMKDAAGIVAALLTRGAALDAPDAGRHTPLHWAASWDAVAAVKVLLDHGASIHVRAHDGSRPLVAATWAQACRARASVAGPVGRTRRTTTPARLRGRKRCIETRAVIGGGARRPEGRSALFALPQREADLLRHYTT